MGNFIEVPIKERVDGAPGIVPDEEFFIHINVDRITLFNRSDDPDYTFVRLTCGATLCVKMPYETIMAILTETGNTVFANVEPEPEPKPKPKKKTTKRRTTSGRKTRKTSK